MARWHGFILKMVIFTPFWPYAIPLYVRGTHYYRDLIYSLAFFRFDSLPSEARGHKLLVTSTWLLFRFNKCNRLVPTKSIPQSIGYPLRAYLPPYLTINGGNGTVKRAFILARQSCQRNQMMTGVIISVYRYNGCNRLVSDIKIWGFASADRQRYVKRCCHPRNNSTVDAVVHFEPLFVNPQPRRRPSASAQKNCPK